MRQKSLTVFLRVPCAPMYTFLFSVWSWACEFGSTKIITGTCNVTHSWFQDTHKITLCRDHLSGQTTHSKRQSSIDRLKVKVTTGWETNHVNMTGDREINTTYMYSSCTTFVKNSYVYTCFLHREDFSKLFCWTLLLILDEASLT